MVWGLTRASSLPTVYCRLKAKAARPRCKGRPCPPSAPPQPHGTPPRLVGTHPAPPAPGLPGGGRILGDRSASPW